LKERLISQFEEWYPREFEVPTGMNAGMMNELEPEAKESSADWLQGTEGVHIEDDDQQTFMNAKKKVEILNRARKMDKMRR
jgi:hypothetical protein